ncbi:post-segregation killing protein PndC [bacterium AH-315-M05]|nr:post-segregation killing protein PndC [bacterium AH-315-M05]
MSTRSSISVTTEDGKVRTVYCHWDGYPAWVGKLLLDHYNSQEKAEKLVELGDISSLDKSIEKPKTHSYDNPVEGHTVFYGRDRGERDTGFTGYDSLGEALRKKGQLYNYQWKDDKWYVNGHVNAELTRDLIDWDERQNDLSVSREESSGIGKQQGPELEI